MEGMEEIFVRATEKSARTLYSDTALDLSRLGELWSHSILYP